MSPGEPQPTPPRFGPSGRFGTPGLRPIAASLLAVAALACGPASADEDPPRPNVLFISVDDLRPELGCYAAGRARTPRLDAFAAGALRFTRAYCQQALCNPSRTSYLTGARPATTQVFEQKRFFRDTMPDVVTLPQHFKAHGYHTLSIGKVFHSNRLDERSWSEPEFLPDRKLIYAREDNRAANKPRVKARVTECEDVPDSTYRDGIVADHAIAALERLKGEPFFMALGFFKPHLPFAAPKRYWDLFPEDAVALPENMDAPLGAALYGLHDSHEVRQYSDAPDSGPFSEELMLRLLRGYLAASAYADAQVGRVLAALEELGLAERTVVVIFGDHGYYLGDHGMWGKSGTFEIAARVPLLVRVPEGLPGSGSRGATTDALVELVDLYPTLSELAQLPLPAHLEGTSFAPLLADPGRAWKEVAFTDQPMGGAVGRSLCTERWRFTRWRTTDREPKVLGEELYDLDAPRGERVNLASAPEHAERVEELRRLLARGWPAARPAR